MKVILTTEAKDIGQKGDEKEVKPGYARNFLFPRNLAIPADTAEAQIILSERKKNQEEKSAEKMLMKEALAGSDNLTLDFYRRAKDKKLFGSIKPGEIIEEIKKKVSVAPKKIEPNKLIKEIGEAKIIAIFSQGEKQKFIVNVRSLEEKPKNSKNQKDTVKYN